MKKALIIAGGEYSPINDITEYGYIIACDKGAFYAKKMNVVPDIIMGDFDSFTGDLNELFPNVPVSVHPVKKDDTDTMLAIKHALKLGFNHIVLCQALGKRLDHTISNIQSLHFVAANGGVGEIISNNEHLITLSSGTSIRIPKREGKSLSVYSLANQCTGVSIKGAEYSVENVTLSNDFPLGHGNSILDDEAVISVSDGILLIVESEINITGT